LRKCKTIDRSLDYESEQPQETHVISEPNLADWPSGIRGLHIVDIDFAEGYNPDRNSEKAKDLAQQLKKRDTIHRTCSYESKPDVQQQPTYELKRRSKTHPVKSNTKSRNARGE
jgi:hypothetical protein